MEKIQNTSGHLKEIVVIGALCVLAYAVSAFTGLHELLDQYTHKGHFVGLEIDAVLILLMTTFAFTVFGLRRWSEANREIRQRRQAEQRISAQNQELETRNADISLLYKISSSITQTISLGISTYSPKMQRVHELINEADKALYQAKHKGKNRAEIWHG